MHKCPNVSVILVVLTNPAASPPLVTADEVKRLAASVYARSVVSLPSEPTFDQANAWEKIVAAVYQTRRVELPESPAIRTVGTGSVADFAALLRTPDAWKAPPGHTDAETPVATFLDRHCRDAAAKLSLLLSEHMQRVSPRLFQEAVQCGLPVDLLLRWPGLTKPLAYEAFLAHPNRPGSTFRV